MGAQSAAVNQTFQHALPRKSLQVRTRFAEPQAAQSDVSDLEFAADQVIERHAARENVSPAFAGGEFDSMVAMKSFDRFDLDQSDLVVGLLFGFREGSRIAKVAVAFEALSRHGANFRDRQDGPGCSLGYEQRNDGSPRHICSHPNHIDSRTQR